MGFRKCRESGSVDPYVFGPSGSVIICTDPELDTDPDPSINKQKKIRKPLISIIFYFFLALNSED